MPAVFITGTDTDVGKTIICSWLAYHVKADYWKPIQTAFPPTSDSATVRYLSAAKTHPETYLLKEPLAPAIAASAARVTIDLAKFQLPATTRPLIVEGAGGLLVPLTARDTNVDLIRHLNIPLIIVARTTLGTINHTCLTLAVARQAGINVLGVILNGAPNPSNHEAIEHYGQTKILGHLLPLNDLTHIRHQPLSPQLRRLFL